MSASGEELWAAVPRDVRVPNRRDAPIAERLAAQDNGPVNAAFVGVFLDKARAPPRIKADGWNRTDEGIERKAKELGVAARRGESYASLKDRVFDEIDRRTRTGAPA